MKLSAILLAGACLHGAAFGQQPNQRPVFEVASVKHVEEVPGESGGVKSTGIPPAITGDPGRISYSAVSLNGILMRAYGVRPNLIVGPDWLKTERYNIEAKVPQDAPKGQIPAMLQSLLADRFHMAVHWGTKEVQGYALVVGKSGPKLTKSAVSDADAPSHRSMSFQSSGHFKFGAHTMDDFAASLTSSMGRPVVDMTEIAGYFDITLDAAPDSMPGLPQLGSANPDAPQLPSIFAAIRELGLNLEPRKVSVKQLLVDSAQKIPTEN